MSIAAAVFVAKSFCPIARSRAEQRGQCGRPARRPGLRRGLLRRRLDQARASVRPEVYKYGFWLPRDSTRYQGEQMPWAEFLSYTRRMRARGATTPATAPKQVQLLDVQDQSAAVKVTASWGNGLSLGWEVRWPVDGVERTVAIEAEGGSVAKRVQRSECVTAAGTTVLARRAYADIIVHYAEHSSP
jgi:hypothetical protein